MDRSSRNTQRVSPWWNAAAATVVLCLLAAVAASASLAADDGPSAAEAAGPPPAPSATGTTDWAAKRKTTAERRQRVQQALDEFAARNPSAPPPQGLTTQLELLKYLELVYAQQQGAAGLSQELESQRTRAERRTEHPAVQRSDRKTALFLPVAGQLARRTGPGTGPPRWRGSGVGRRQAIPGFGASHLRGCRTATPRGAGSVRSEPGAAGRRRLEELASKRRRHTVRWSRKCNG